jgi:hypothetical protein
MREGDYDEDFPGTRTTDHAYNPLTGETFVFGSMNALETAADRWGRMVRAFGNGNFDGGDGSGAWHFLGRASHMLQDMTSPLHVLAQQHAVISCKFEDYWDSNDASLRSLLTPLGGPLHSSRLDPKAAEKLDAFTAGRLTTRFNSSCPNKDADDIRGWVEVLSWATYFRATFWGQIKMGSSSGNGSATSASTTSTTFSDGTVGPQTNVLHTMFKGRVRWINHLLGDDYYEITDRKGNVFRFMSLTDIDDWASCGQFWANRQQDSSTKVGGDDDDSDGVRITGRFWFDTRELGKNSSGEENRYCYPDFYPDGTAMTDHLHEYYGACGYPMTVRYGAGLLGLANRGVTVKTADAAPARGFAWGRMDNFARPATFDAGPGGVTHYFAAKSAVTLTAPPTDSGGLAFARWLRDGAPFSGNTSRTITINDASLWIPESGVTYIADYGPPTPAVATPVISPSGGEYFRSVTVTLSCTTPGAAIRYTLDGTVPTPSSIVYSAPFTLTNTTLVRAQAFAAAQADSAVAAGSYTVNWPPPITTVAAGTYQGLFFPTSGPDMLVNHEASGAFSLKVKDEGTFSGKLLAASGTHAFSGRFVKGVATVSVRRPTTLGGALTLVLRCGAGGDAEAIGGELALPGGTAEVLGYRAVYSSKSPAPQAGKCTVHLYASLPGEGTKIWGAGSLSISPSGQTRFTGKLADGTVISLAVPLCKGGRWPLYVKLYRGQGSILGWAQCDESRTLAGEAGWTRPAGLPGARQYPQGFTQVVDISGLAYNAPPSGESVLSFQTGIAIFTGGRLSAPFTNHVALAVTGNVNGSGGDKLKFRINRSTGVLTGTADVPGSGLSRPVYGVVSRAPVDEGFGFFLDDGLSGSVSLVPEP